MLGFSPLSETPLASLHGEVTYAVPKGVQAQYHLGDVALSAASSIEAVGVSATFSVGTPIARAGRTAYPYGVSSVFRLGQVDFVTGVNLTPAGVQAQFDVGNPIGSVDVEASPLGVYASYSLGDPKLFLGINAAGVEAEFAIPHVEVKGVNNVFVQGVSANFESGEVEVVAVSSIIAEGSGAQFYLNDVGIVVHAEAAVDATLNQLRFSIPKLITWGDITSCRDTHNDWKDIPT